MIALLPLRGWMGDAMATQMAVQALQVAQAPSSSSAEESPAAQPALRSALAANAMAAGIPADCLSHSSADAGQADSASTDAGCENCSACQACHTVALSPSGLSHAAGILSGTHPAGAVTPFASAEAVSGQKPPIS